MAKYLRNEPLIKAVGSKLRQLRKKKGLTMMDLVDLSGIEYNQLSLIERGKVNTSISHIEKLANVLGIKLKDLFDTETNQGG